MSLAACLSSCIYLPHQSQVCQDEGRFLNCVPLVSHDPFSYRRSVWQHGIVNSHAPSQASMDRATDRCNFLPTPGGPKYHVLFPCRIRASTVHFICLGSMLGWNESQTPVCLVVGSLDSFILSLTSFTLLFFTIQPLRNVDVVSL